MNKSLTDPGADFGCLQVGFTEFYMAMNKDIIFPYSFVASYRMEEKKHSKLVSWLKRIGLLGFLFFLIKGLIWLAVIYLSARGVMK